MPRSPSSSSDSSASPSPSPVQRRRVIKGGAAKKGKKGTKKGTRKPTHWLVLVQAIYSVNGPKGSTGLTAAMKEGSSHLQAFKAAFSAVPSESAAVDWVRKRL